MTRRRERAARFAAEERFERQLRTESEQVRREVLAALEPFRDRELTPELIAELEAVVAVILEARNQ